MHRFCLQSSLVSSHSELLGDALGESELTGDLDMDGVTLERLLGWLDGDSEGDLLGVLVLGVTLG